MVFPPLEQPLICLSCCSRIWRGRVKVHFVRRDQVLLWTLLLHHIHQTCKVNYQCAIWKYLAKEGSSEDFLQAIRGEEMRNHLAAQVLDKAADITASMENTLHSNNGNDEATGCLTSNSRGRDVDLPHADPANPRAKDYRTNNVSGPTLHRDPVLSQPDAPSQNQCTAYPAENSQVSLGEPHTKKAPSFQFYVSSEEGINLFVDLTSSPSSWIKSLKDEVNICQSLHDNLLCNDPGGSDESMNTSICPGMQTSRLESRLDFLHTQSSLSSLTRDNPLSVTSQDSFPVRRPDPSGQDNSVISSSYDLNEGRIPQTVNVVLNECACDLAASMHAEAVEHRLSRPSCCQTITDSEIADPHTSSLLNVDSSVPGKLEALGDLSSSNIDTFNRRNVACQENSVSLEMQLATISSLDEEDDGPPGFYRPLAVMDVQNVELQNQHLEEGVCSPKEQQRSHTENTRESCTQLDSSLSETSKRIHGSGSIESLPSKRHRRGATRNYGHAGTTIGNLGTVMPLAREELVPRRSKRLRSK
ncbi:uncharacterized protein [Aristolochia californica]|uniref:uncharacterized protein isoform X2 n=1 Tax=Aristolochia californica TaxID=171875 RepID=UPI0035DAFAB8